MAQRLLTVEDSFQTSSKDLGLIVVPGPLQDEYPGSSPIQVELRKPDGSTQRATLHVSWMFQTPPPKEYRWICHFRDLLKGDVPIGTEIWVGVEA